MNLHIWISQIEGLRLEHWMSFHWPFAADMLMQSSWPCMLFGSTLSQFVYTKVAPELDTNLPSAAITMF